MQQKRLFWNLFVKFCLFLVGCCVGFFVIYAFDTFFRIETVHVSGLPIKEKKIITDLFKKERTLLFNEQKSKEQLYMRIPGIRDISLQIRYPHTLDVSAHLSLPFVYLQSNQGYFTLSDTGVILEKKREKVIPAPQIYLYEVIHHNTYQAGQLVDFSSIKKALQFVQLLKKEGYSVERVDIDSVDMIACKVNGVDILFSQTKSIDTQRHEFTQIAKQMRIGALRIVRLDLRFSKPVVELKK